ncbi:MAG: DUF4405 domain-containing protein [Phycisphaeraceae bacterium]
MTALIRHIANLGLLLSFTTLAVTGVMSFVLPFSITTARVHIVFGLATVLLVGLHLATRLRYFTRIAKQTVALKSKAKPQAPRWLVVGVAVVWAGLLYLSLADLQPTRALIATGYEARHKAEIFRATPQTAYEKLGQTHRVVSLSPSSGQLLVEVEVEYKQALEKQPAAAIWAEDTRGNMIQTLFVDEALAYSATPTWNGKKTPRHHILPIWRFGYSQINGVDPVGDVNAVTEATPKHSFSIEQQLLTDDPRKTTFNIWLEINAAGDPNDAYPDEHLGQPSVLYVAQVEIDSDQDYYLMQRIAHGGGAEENGIKQYDFEDLTTAAGLVEKVLVHIQRPERE